MKEYSHEFADHWFYTPTAFEKASGIWPVRGGMTVSKPHYKIGPRFITYYSLHFVLDGQGVFSQDGQSIKIQQGDIFCLAPKKTHQYYTDPADCLKMFWFAFDGKQAEDLVRRIGISENTPYVSGLFTEDVIQLLKELGEKFSEINEVEALERISLIYKLFFLSKTAIEKDKVKIVNSTNWFERSIYYMQKHFSEGITVNDIAKHLGINRSYFTSSFKKEMGIGPMNYLTDLKMKQAYQMLKNPDVSITEIALSIGYSDLYSFSRAFKSYYDLSPTQFRENKMSSSL